MFIIEVELSINGHGNVFVKVFSLKIELYDSFPFQKKMSHRKILLIL